MKILNDRRANLLRGCFLRFIIIRTPTVIPANRDKNKIQLSIFLKRKIIIIRTPTVILANRDKNKIQLSVFLKRKIMKLLLFFIKNLKCNEVLHENIK